MKMLSTSNWICRFILSGINGKNLIPLATRNYHLMMNSTSLGLTATSVFNQTMIAPVQLGITSNLLPTFNPILSQVAGFKVKGHLRRRCKDCYFVMRQQRLYVICKTHPRHKQMSMKARDYKSWILTHATQSKIRPY